jgi:hypothetical protein
MCDNASSIGRGLQMITVKIYSIDSCDPDVSDVIRTFDSYDDMFNEIIHEHGEEDVTGRDIRDEQYGEDEIIVEGDVWFKKWLVIKD